MSRLDRFYIGGQWVEPQGEQTLDVINPATETCIGQVAMGSEADAVSAIQAARQAFAAYSRTTREERIHYLERILERYNARYDELVQAVTLELGSPLALSRDAQVSTGQIHLETTLQALRDFAFEEQRGDVLVAREAIGVCTLITPWNWPLNQIVCKVAPALAAGCTMVLKPSEIAPLSALLFAGILDEAGLPPGVFNLVNGSGSEVGNVLTRHPEVDMVSFTGSTRAGVAVAKNAADTVKRVAQELGGKSPNLIFADADLRSAVTQGIDACFSNTGQSCDAPTRMLVPEQCYEEVVQIAQAHVRTIKVGDPMDPDSVLGPVISRAQFEKIQDLIQSGLDEGAQLICGGAGRPDNLPQGYYVKPTIFGNATMDMRIVREEIFGPVLCIQTYSSEEQAIALANEGVYGLAAYVQSADLQRARRVARQLRAGSVYINYPEWSPQAPFGGYKHSGNGREYADWGIHDYLEIKGISGWGPSSR
ncbi:aldehyde dehydrogenase family protein [Pseudomonas sp. 3A(2025)]